MGYRATLIFWLLVPIRGRQVVTNAVTDVDKQNFHKQRLTDVGSIYIQGEINKSGHDKCMRRVGGIHNREGN